jgi:TPR repeat protein
MNISDLRQKTQNGSAVAQTIRETCHLEGIDVEVDHEEAFRLLSAAADQGAPRAKMNLARMYAKGWVRPRTWSRQFSFTKRQQRRASF